MLKQGYWNVSLHLSPDSIFITLIFLERNFSSFPVSLITLPIQYAMKYWQMRLCFQNLWNMKAHTLKYFRSEKKKLVIKFVSYLNSHITLDLHTTIFKLSSVAPNCGISILPVCTGEDKEDGGKVDLHVYLDSQLSNLC